VTPLLSCVNVNWWVVCGLAVASVIEALLVALVVHRVSRRKGDLSYDLCEDVIVKLRFDSTLTKEQQHGQCKRIWDAAHA